MNEIEVNSKPRGYKEGRASFPDQCQYKNSKSYGSTSTPREERERIEKGTEGAPGGDESGVWFLGSRGR